MTEFTLHTLDTAPLASRKSLQKAEKQMGFIPNLFAVMAESPAILEAYQTLIMLFDKTSFTVTEQQLVFSVSAASTIAPIAWQHMAVSRR